MKPEKGNMYALFFKKNILKIQCFDNTETNKIFSYNAQTPISCISLSNNKNNNDYQNILLFDKFITRINKFCKNSNVKDVWVYGYDFKKSNELNNTKFASFAKKISKGNKLKINGLSTKTLKQLKVNNFQDLVNNI